MMNLPPIGQAQLQRYVRVQQASLQWAPILRALAAEISTHSDPETLRQLFSRIGQRFAFDMSAQFSDTASLVELADALNDFWERLNWGWVSFLEEADGIDIHHRCAPLAEAFGDEALPWSIGLLEGFYETLFRQMGAGASVSVRDLGNTEDGMDLRLRLAL